MRLPKQHTFVLVFVILKIYIKREGGLSGMTERQKNEEFYIINVFKAN
jgi:hypothetical protein